MCLLQTNATADAGFAELDQAEKASKYERTLGELAESASINEAGGLENRLHPLSSWWDNPELRRVRKYRQGSHRFYIQGRHTDCHYLICWVKVHKRTEEDPEEDPRFQQRILAALEDPPTRTLNAPALDTGRPVIVLPSDLMIRAFAHGDSAARQTLVQIARSLIIDGYEATSSNRPNDVELNRLAHMEVSKAEGHYWETVGQE